MPGRYDELAGRVDLTPMKREGVGEDTVGAEGQVAIGRFNPGQKQRRRFVFNAPAHISWPVLNEQVSRPAQLASICAKKRRKACFVSGQCMTLQLK